jgi:HTH-type transcriptional regulator/antitoxin HigA
MRKHAMTDVAAVKAEWKPNWAVHPGALLQEHLESQGLTQAEFARVAGLTPKLVSTIIKGLNPVTAETAIKLERVLGLKAYIWTTIQAKWDLFQARAEAEPDTKWWLERFPIRELTARKYLPDTDDEKVLTDSLLRMFHIGTPQGYDAKVRSLAVHHRKSNAYLTSECHVFTWLMIGEHKARQMNLPVFNAQKFDKGVREIRNLTMESLDVFKPMMETLCHEAGVALVFEPALSRTSLFGSARWFDVDRAIIQMSLRMKTNDHFWWTFFHEAAHIILHRGKTFLDDKNGVGDGIENEADLWAEDILVGREQFARFIATHPRSKAEIESFGNEIGLHPGIIVGMLQHSRVLPFNHLNGLKTQFQWVQE